jgi:hypothetical protein
MNNDLPIHGSMVGLRDKRLEDQAADSLARNVDRRERRVGELGKVDVVEARDRDFFRDTNTALIQFPKNAQSHEIVDAQNGRRPESGGQQIVDFYHAVQHLKALLEALLGKEHPEVKKLLGRWKRWLLQDRVEKIIDGARARSQAKPCQEAVAKALHYFEHNVSRMQYGTFRKLGYFIGSGVVEAGCKTIIGSRCKQSGMFWSEPGAENILALRCIRRSRQWQTFWKNRANEHAARNDTLSLAT